MNLVLFLRTSVLGLVLLAMATAGNAVAEDWPHWRGPNHNGTSSETGLPGNWNNENILWKTAMPGQSSASPIVVGDRVYCVSNAADMTALNGMCVNRETGVIIWQKVFAQDVEQPQRNTLASPSPVSDGKRVFFMFGTGDLVACDLDGAIVWRKNLIAEYGPISPQFGYSSTPLIFEGHLYIMIIRGQWDRAKLDDFTDEDAHLICMDPATGDVIWRVHRPSDGADEAMDSYSSPMPYAYGDVSAILTQGGNYVVASDAATGKELWRQNHNPERGRMWRLIPSPMAAGELVIGVQPRGQAAFAIKPEEGKSFAYSESAWIFDEKTTDVPCPVYYKDRVYLLNGVRGLLFCLDAKTGSEVWTGVLKDDNYSRVWASPVVAEDKMYCLTEDGQVITMAIGDSFQVLSRNMLGGEACKSTMAIAGGKVYARTSDALYGIGSK